jgi:pimeloyl-ACP methyl ester carboxylesterase
VVRAAQLNPEQENSTTNMLRLAAVARCAVLASAVFVGTLATTNMAAADGEDSRGPLILKKQGNFFVGGTHNANDQIVGQMYVEYWIPQNQEHSVPIILVHGGGQIGAGWSQTPDGREGWVQFFVRRGFPVYVVDQPARGRSAYNSELGPLSDPFASLPAQQLFAAPERFNLWPAAHLHTRWVGPAVDGDPTFEQFLASQAASIDNGLQEGLTADALIALLDEIGPAILVPHSQPGFAAWLVADRRPDLLKALVTIEPGGPPVVALRPFGTLNLPWGLTIHALTYSPPVSDPSQLMFVDTAITGDPYVTSCLLQQAPARQLPNIQRVRILYLSSEAGYNTLWDPCTTRYLTQAGVNFTWIRLQNIGIHGNSHFMFIEQNSDQVAGVVLDWIERHALNE